MAKKETFRIRCAECGARAEVEKYHYRYCPECALKRFEKRRGRTAERVAKHTAGAGRLEKRPDPKRRLKKREKAFAELFAAGLSMPAAVIEAGYNYTMRRSAARAGGRMMKDPAIRREIARHMAANQVDAVEVMSRLSDQARANVADLAGALGGGTCQEVAERAAEAGVSHLIKSITPTRDGPKVLLHDQTKALELLGKAHGLFVERLELSGPDLDAAIEAELARGRELWTIVDAEVVEEGEMKALEEGEPAWPPPDVE